MKTESLLSDPVFQLNLLLWMAKEQPAEAYCVRPLFRELDFEIIYIEHPFPLPEEIVSTIDQSGLEVSRTPEPELILGRKHDNRALYFEAKADSFSPASSNCKQARGHMVAAGPAFAEVMTPYQSCLLCYVLPKSANALMRRCLKALQKELASAKLDNRPFSVHGLSVRGTDLVYSWDRGFIVHTGARGASAAVMHNLSEDTDPSPLLLVYTDEDCPDPERQGLYRKAVLNQIHAEMLCQLQTWPPSQPYEVTTEGLLLKMTDGIFQYLGRERQKSMRRLVRENLFRRVHEFWQQKQPGIVAWNFDMLRVEWASASNRDEFLDWLEDYNRTAFSDEKPPATDMPLLPDAEDPAGGESK
jgi:hypothetical protein